MIPEIIGSIVNETNIPIKVITGAHWGIKVLEFYEQSLFTAISIKTRVKKADFFIHLFMYT